MRLQSSVAACLTILAILAIEVAVLGAAAAGGAAQEAGLTIPMPRVGDEVRYTYSMVPDPAWGEPAQTSSIGPQSTLVDGNNAPNAPTTPWTYRGRHPRHGRLRGERTLLGRMGQLRGAYRAVHVGIRGR